MEDKEVRVALLKVRFEVDKLIEELDAARVERDLAVAQVEKTAQDCNLALDWFQECQREKDRAMSYKSELRQARRELEAYKEAVHGRCAFCVHRRILIATCLKCPSNEHFVFDIEKFSKEAGND